MHSQRRKFGQKVYIIKILNELFDSKFTHKRKSVKQLKNSKFSVKKIWTKILNY